MKTKLIIISIAVVFLLTSILFAKLYIEQTKESNRLENNLITANKSVEYYKTEKGKLAVKNDALKLKYKEVSKIYPGILAEIQNLKVKMKHVTNYSETIINNEKEIITNIRDSIINDTVTARVFCYTDEFYNVKGILIADTQKVNISSTDSLIQVVYKGKRYKPYLWFLSRRRLQQAITSKNPNSTIKYNRYIKIEK